MVPDSVVGTWRGGERGVPGAGGSGKTGTVATERGAGLAGGGTLTGCSSRETSRSPAAVPPAVASREAPPWELPALGIILVGPPSALMMGGNDGSTVPPNIAR